MSKPPLRTAGNEGAPEGSPAPVREGGAEMLGGGNLDQVREILFGAQSRSLDKRLARLEEELPRRVAEIREDLKRGLDTLESYARTEIDALNERLRVESKERGKGDAELAGRVDDTGKALRKEVAELDERTSAAQRDLRQQILEQAKRLDAEIQRRTDDLAAALARAVEELRHEKADRKAVAGILHEVALRLADELSLPITDSTQP